MGYVKKKHQKDLYKPIHWIAKNYAKKKFLHEAIAVKEYSNPT